MINLDQLSTDKNSSLLANDWQKKLTPAVDNPILHVDPPKFADDAQQRPRPTDPVTPADAADPVPAPSAQNPSPETPGDLLSAPNDDNESSSSLSPVPSPNPQHDEERPPADPPGPQEGAASRQSTPLTDLSNPATPSHPKEDDTAEHSDVPKKDAQDGDDVAMGSEADATVVAPDPVVELDKSRSAPDPNVPPKSLEPAGNGAAPAQPLNGAGSASASPAAPEIDHSAAPQKAPELPADEKASAILQLNTELLKVCIECQTRNMMQTPEFNTYAQRLQSNLTWLAAAADRARQTQIPLPIMSPPAPVPFTAPQTINDYYQRLPLLFAKEIAKRQKEAAQAGVKRGPDTAADDAMRKRLDTGERRLSHPPSVPAVSPPHARSPSVLSNGAAAGHVSPEALGMMTPQQPQPSPQRMSPESSQPPPSQQQQPPLPSQQQFPGAGANMSDAQMAQMRERARQMALRQGPTPAQGMMPKDVPRSSMMPPNGGAGAGAGGQQQHQMMQAVMGAFGQAGLQNFHALQQGISHPFVSYMNQNVPGFMQMPVQQQLQRMQIVQNNIQQVRAQQAQRAVQQAAGNPGGMNGAGMPDAGSPFGRHSGSPPDVGAPHLQASQMQQMNGMGAPPMQQPSRQGLSLAPQRAPPPPPPMNMANLAALTPQQRQLLLMQQQMHQRGNDGVMNPQQVYAEKMRQEQQRLAQHAEGSPPADPGTPRMLQKQRSDPYHMALYNTAQAQQRQAAGVGMRPGTAMGYGGAGVGVGGGGAGGGTVNPGMMQYAGGAHASSPQNWQAQQAPPQFHAVSPAALQHHPDAGTPRPGSAASAANVAGGEGMGDSFDALFNWGGT